MWNEKKKSFESQRIGNERKTKKSQTGWTEGGDTKKKVN